MNKRKNDGELVSFSAKKPRIVLTIEQKLEIIKFFYLNDNVSHKKAEQFSTLSKI